MRNLITTGAINKKGQHGFANIREFELFAKKHPNTNTIINVMVEDKGRKGRLAYYHHKVLEDWQWQLYKQQGEIKTKQQINEMLQSGFPILKNKGLSDLSDQELLMFMDYVEHKTIEEINVYCENARVL